MIEIDYDAKGQRETMAYGNGANTAYTYDPVTFRLLRLYTTRPSAANGLASSIFATQMIVQDLNYTYDPQGNITRLWENALPVLYYNNEQIEPLSDYTYDPIYRLISAMGREQIAQAAFAPFPPTGDLRDYPFVGLAVSPLDFQAMQNYTEQYNYDSVGNILSVNHSAASGGWNRNNIYDNSSTNPANNQLTSSIVGSITERYGYDVNGNMKTTPQLAATVWDFKNQLQMTQQQAVNDGTAPQTYYVYEFTGQRVRKVNQSSNTLKTNERVYVGNYEVYYQYSATDPSTVSLERDSLHVIDDKRHIAIIETQAGGATVERYQFANHLQSAQLELDESALVISYEEYYPYGSSSFQAANSQAEVSAKMYRYTGKERDEESGFYYHGARYYAPWIQRWATCDPLGLSDGPNLYAYVRGSPARLADPRGTQASDRVNADTRHIWRGQEFSPTVIRGDVPQRAATEAPNLRADPSGPVDSPATQDAFQSTLALQLPTKTDKEPTEAEAGDSLGQRSLTYLSERFSGLEKAHFGLDVAAKIGEATVKAGERFAKLHGMLYRWTSSYHTTWKLMLPNEWSTAVAGVSKWSARIGKFLGVAEELAPPIQIASGIWDVKEGFKEKQEREYVLSALDASKGLVGIAVGAAVIAGALEFLLALAIAVAAPLLFEGLKDYYKELLRPELRSLRKTLESPNLSQEIIGTYELVQPGFTLGY